LVGRLPVSYVLAVLAFILLVYLIVFLLAWWKNREISLFWGLIKLSPPRPTVDHDALQQAIERIDAVHGEIGNQRESGLLHLDELRIEEQQLTTKLVDPRTYDDIRELLKQRIEQIRQDKSRLERTIVERLTSLERSIEELSGLLKKQGGISKLSAA
jgi:hypothetical protein